ncbi:MAG: TetR/AcrR family transcriptional regulator [Oceanicoccus sp.]
MTQHNSKHPNCSPRHYHHGDLRQKLIDGACTHLRSGSAHDLSLRSLARELGVSQTAPYRHFASKGDLFVAIAVYGFELLSKAVNEAKSNCENDPEKLLIQQGLAYINWAEKNPEKYQLFFDSCLVNSTDNPELQKAGTNSFQLVLDTIGIGIAQGVFLDRPVVELGAVVWSFVHGSASLLISTGDIGRHSDREDAVATGVSSIADNRESNMALFVGAIKKP